MEIDVVGQDENLFDIVALNLTYMFTIFGIVEADTDHFPHQSTDNEEDATVHTGNGVVDYDNFILADITVGMTSPNEMVEVQKRNKVALAFAETSGNLPILADNLIDILLTMFFPQSETLKTRITEQVVYTFNGRSGADDAFVEVGNFYLQIPRSLATICY
jgi:hypothetical protein